MLPNKKKQVLNYLINYKITRQDIMESMKITNQVIGQHIDWLIEHGYLVKTNGYAPTQKALDLKLEK